MKAFEGMIRGFEVIIHTNHLNLLYSKMPNQRMMRWRLLLEDFHPIVKHIAGDNNLSADALSRLKMVDDAYDVQEWEPPSKRLTYSDDNPHVEMLHSMLELDNKDNTYDKSLYESTGEQQDAEDSFALSFSHMQQDQQNDRAFNNEVEKLLRQNLDRFTQKEIDGIQLIHENDRVLVPMAARERLINLYHETLVHPGIDKQLNTMKSVLFGQK